MNNRVLRERFLFAEYIDEENGDYVKVKYRKIEEYHFYLRFISEWFQPCRNCQQKIKELLNNGELHISTSRATVDFLQLIDNGKIVYEFGFPFIRQLILYTWRPCAECQKELSKVIQKASSLIIGNDKYEHPVELNRKMGDDDESFETVVKHKATKTEKERIGQHWLYESIDEKTYRETPTIKE